MTDRLPDLEQISGELREHGYHDWPDWIDRIRTEEVPRLVAEAVARQLARVAAQVEALKSPFVDPLYSAAYYAATEDVKALLDPAKPGEPE